jgi:hypothetical protein
MITKARPRMLCRCYLQFLDGNVMADGFRALESPVFLGVCRSLIGIVDPKGDVASVGTRSDDS